MNCTSHSLTHSLQTTPFSILQITNWVSTCAHEQRPSTPLHPYPSPPHPTHFLLSHSITTQSSAYIIINTHARSKIINKSIPRNVFILRCQSSHHIINFTDIATFGRGNRVCEFAPGLGIRQFGFADEFHYLGSAFSESVGDEMV